MQESAILQTIKELERWEKRRDEIIKEINNCEEDIRDEKKKELGKIEDQISYYRKLIAEMKKEVKPIKTSDFFDALR